MTLMCCTPFLLSYGMIEQKRKIRNEIRQRKQLLTEDDKRKASVAVCEQLLADNRFAEGVKVVLFWSMTDEVCTHEMVCRLAEKREVFLPVIVGDDLVFRKYEGPESMKPESQFGIMEPTSQVTLSSVDGGDCVIVVPGVAFTVEGLRMGRGRGYYDRILKSLPCAYKIGICYKCQIVDDLPTEAHDIAMDKVIWG